MDVLYYTNIRAAFVIRKGRGCLIYPTQNIEQVDKMRGFKTPGSGVHPASYAMRLFGGLSGQTVKITIHLLPEPSLRRRGAVSSLPHTFSWRGILN